MNKLDALITMASWEDRFRLGAVAHIDERRPLRVIMFHFGEPYASWTADNRAAVRRQCEQADVTLDEVRLAVDEPAVNWTKVAESVQRGIQSQSAVEVDLTTMPRELIWWVFRQCEFQGGTVEYIYHRPGTYGEWLSRDPQRPRLVYRMSGIASLARKTALVMLAGYDVERCQQLINFFEPSLALIGLQKDSVDPKNPEQMQRHKDRFKDSGNVSFFETDAYAGDRGRSNIDNAINNMRASHNVVLSSLGPKLSAVALYQMQRDDPSLALAYAPSKEFSRDYSTGIGEAITGKL